MASWAAKALLHEGRVYLYSHIASKGNSASLALIKEVVERAPGNLELRYVDQLAPLETGETVKPGTRAKFFEIYLDDVWQITVSQPDAAPTGNLELTTERGEARFCGLRLAHLRSFDPPLGV